MNWVGALKLHEPFKVGEKAEAKVREIQTAKDAVSCLKVEGTM